MKFKRDFRWDIKIRPKIECRIVEATTEIEKEWSVGGERRILLMGVRRQLVGVDSWPNERRWSR